MSYCFNPACTRPGQNPEDTKVCQGCGSELLLRNQGRVYRMKKCLGQGGFGATFLAAEENLPGRPLCVIKQLRPPINDPNNHVYAMARELFEREAAILGRIGNHPKLASLRDYFEQAPWFYMVQEYVEGKTLQMQVREAGTYDEQALKDFLKEILPVLQYLHDNGTIHRDIKPANIMRRSLDNALILIDFGAVKEVGETPMGGGGELTQYAIGTAGYAPPEQLAMRPVYASDIYALGATSLFLLTGKAPKDLTTDPTTGEIQWRQYVRVSDSFAQVLDRMLAPDPKQRFTQAGAVLRALESEPSRGEVAQGGRPAGRAGAPETPPVSEVTQGQVGRMADAIRARRARMEKSEALGTSSGRMTSSRLKSEYIKGKRDFAGQDMRGLDLQSANLTGIVLHDGLLSQVNFQDAVLESANLGRANLQKAKLVGANLHRAYLSFADLEGADLRNADLTEAYLRNANLREANLCGADLTGALISNEQLSAARTNWATIMPNGRKGSWWPL